MSEAKKVHTDELEHLVTLAPLSLVNGIIYPWTTIGLLSFYLFGRMMYTNGLLITDGEAKMIVGSTILNASHLATIGLTTFMAIRLIRGQLCL